MHNNLSNQPPHGQPILVYRHKSASPLYGAAVLETLKHLEGHAGMLRHSEQISDWLTHRFPRGTFVREDRSSLELFKQKDRGFSADLETILIPCSNDPTILDESYFRYRGYLINPEHQRLDVLRGDHLEEPTQVLFDQFDDKEKQYAIEALSRRNKTYFPYRIEKSYRLDALPSATKFLNDMTLLR